MENNRLLRLYNRPMKNIFLLTFLLSFQLSWATETSYKNKIYSDSIHTVLLHRVDWALANADIALNSNEQLSLSFDDFSINTKNYSYTIEHCTHDWKSSELSKMEFLSGFHDLPINNFEQSFNTYQKYWHYSVEFPNSDFQISKSGNYLLKVFQDNDEEKLILTRRFRVYEDLMSVTAEIKRPTDANGMYTHHEIDFSIVQTGYQVSDVYNNLHVVLQQNNRWDNAIFNLTPQFIRDNELLYDYNGDNWFKAGNEFRYFDTKSFQFKNDRIHSINFDDGRYSFELLPEPKRGFKRYILYDDINGRRYIQIEDSQDNNLDADYVQVKFTVPEDRENQDQDLYIVGEFSDWQLKDKYKLKYNADFKRYFLETILKQGYYNFYIATSDKGKKEIDLQEYEGNFWQTENEYTIGVYAYDFDGSYERLVALQYLKSAGLR